MTNWTCTTLAQDYVLLMALLYKGRCRTGHNKHVRPVKTKCQVPLFQSINPFSSTVTNTSIYHILMIMPQSIIYLCSLQSLTNLQQFKYSKKLMVYIFLTSLCASCFCTVCPVHLVSQVENVNRRRTGLSVCKLRLQQAK